MNAAAAVTIFGSNGRAVCAHLLITYSFQKKQIVLPSSAFEAEPPDLSHKKKNFNINTILNMLMEKMRNKMLITSHVLNYFLFPL